MELGAVFLSGLVSGLIGGLIIGLRRQPCRELLLSPPLVVPPVRESPLTRLDPIKTLDLTGSGDDQLAYRSAYPDEEGWKDTEPWDWEQVGEIVRHEFD